MNPFAGNILTSSAEAWVELVAAHTNPTRVQWLTDPADCEGIVLRSSTGGRRAERPVTIMSSMRREAISDSSEFLIRAMATARFWPFFRGSMRGRVMYVLPYVVGRGSRSPSAGVQVTDDPLLAAILGRTVDLDGSLRHATRLVRSVHATDTECAPTICCFSDDRVIWAPSVSASDFIDARTHALRLASLEVLDVGYAPARVTIVRLANTPGGRPLTCGVIAPGDFGRAPGSIIGLSRQRTAYRVLATDAAWLTVEDGELQAVLCEKAPAPSAGDDLQAVPLDALVFCTRRASTVPVVVELSGWARACYAATTLTADAEATSAPDPMGMGGFCGADINTYLDRWLAMGPRLNRPPRLFQVNWFLRGSNGSLLWPALSEAWRIMSWITARVEGRAAGRMTCAGLVPALDELDRAGLVLPDDAWRALLDVSPTAWERELELHEGLLAALGKDLPLELYREHRALKERVLATSPRRIPSAEVSQEKSR